MLPNGYRVLKDPLPEKEEGQEESLSGLAILEKDFGIPRDKPVAETLGLPAKYVLCL